MATCKDCLGYEWCCSCNDCYLPGQRYHELKDVEKYCDSFKDAKRFVEIPCEPGSKVWTKHGYTFEVEKIELLKDEKIFRCGNPGTNDYWAFFENEIDERVFLSEESYQNATNK